MWVKYTFVATILAVILGASDRPWTVHAAGKNKVDRKIFVSAKGLAVACQAMKDTAGMIDPATLASMQLSASDMFAVGRCLGYVEGVADEFREATGTPYRPISAGRGELPLLIQAFLKRVADHPDEANLAASTVLHEADRDVLTICGDCNFGLLVHSPHKQ